MATRPSALKLTQEETAKAYDDAFNRARDLATQHNIFSLMNCDFLHNCHFVLSFNYTNTFEALYGNQSTEYCYIHGKAQKKAGHTNMIFGVNETLNNGNENKHFVFAKFKKYFQRIVNGTGSEYKDWIKNIASDAHQSHEIYILGHSLDITDHEVLREFFDTKGNKVTVRITILYHDGLSKIRAIEKTIEMIGKDELIRRVHGGDWTIRFKNQYDAELSIMQNLNTLKSSPSADFWRACADGE